MRNAIHSFLKIGLLGLVFCQTMAALAAPVPQEKGKTEQAQSVNINTADAETLQTLPRVGPVIAQRIIAYRKEHGGFKTLEELMNVSGIGEKTFERLRNLISL